MRVSLSALGPFLVNNKLAKEKVLGMYCEKTCSQKRGAYYCDSFRNERYNIRLCEVDDSERLEKQKVLNASGKKLLFYWMKMVQTKLGRDFFTLL
jgi:hypothetical protein